MLSTYESEVKRIPYPQEKVYAKLSDLNNLKSVEAHLPQDKVKDLTYDTDSFSCNISPIGNITFRIIEREPCKCIKLEADNLPVAFNLWVQIVSLDNYQCKMRLVAKAELNMFLKGMIEKPLKEMLEKMATTIAGLPYE